MEKNTTPDSLYGNSRDILREAERENEILADIAGETYDSPGDIPKGKYIIEKRLLDAAQKKNELLESIAGGGGAGGGAAKGIAIDYGTDVISLKNKDGDPIQGSGATLPAYGVSFDPTTGGLTLTKNGTAMQGQSVTIPNYGSPVGVTSSSDMTDHGTIYLYEGTTGGGYTNGHFYWWDGTAWADGGEYAAATVQTDKTLTVENRAADAKAVGDAVGELKESYEELNDQIFDFVEFCTATQFNENFYDIWTLNQGKTYKIVMVPNTTFECGSIQIGTSKSGSTMVDTIAENVSMTANDPVEFVYTASVNNLKAIRIFGQAGNFSSIKLYEAVSRIDENDKKSTNAENTANDGHNQLYAKSYGVWQRFYSISGNNNFVSIPNALTNGKTYLLTVKATSAFTLEHLGISTHANTSNTIQEIAYHVNISVGDNQFIFTAKHDELKFLWVQGNASNIVTTGNNILNVTNIVEVSEASRIDQIYNDNYIPAVYATFKNEDESYLKIAAGSNELQPYMAYKLVLTSKAAFTEYIQMGSQPNSGSMTETIGSNVSIAIGDNEFVFIPTHEDLIYLRVYQHATDILSAVVYPAYPTYTAKITQIEDDIYVQIYDEYSSFEYRNTSYWYTPNSSDALEAGIRYRLVINAKNSFALTAPNGLQMGSTGSSAGMTDTIAANASLVVGDNEFWFTPQNSGLKFLRIYEHADDVNSVDFYTDQGKALKADIALEEIKAIEERIKDLPAGAILQNAAMLRNTTAETRRIKNETDESIASLLPLKISDNSAVYTATIPAMGAHDRAIVRIGMHYGSRTITNQNYRDYDEIYFEGNCKQDFSDVRFFDANGNLLKAEFGPLMNMELCADKNLDNVIKALSDGTLIKYDETNGIMLSSDGGANFSAISGTSAVTVNGSQVYNRKSMYPVFVDDNDNIFAYAGGIMYKLDASDNYATKTAACDFSWEYTDGGTTTTIYPDVQDHGMDMDSDGNLFFGVYQPQYHVAVYASSNGGNSFALSYHDYDGVLQHVHHIHADRISGSGKVYVGVDDGSATLEGAHVIVTDDGGSTWTDITAEMNMRGKDYYPNYFGADYRLGSGETYLMGSGLVYRSEDDKDLNVVVRGVGGVRSITDFGDDSMIICGSQGTTVNGDQQIFISKDKGRTWQSIYKRYVPAAYSGYGYRNAVGPITLPGESVPCVILPKDIGPDNTNNATSFKVYNGGDYWYREAFVEIPNVLNTSFTITAKCGYAIKYPYNCLETEDHHKPVYEIRLNEGIGNFVLDSNGVVHEIAGNYIWDAKQESVHFGPYSAPTKYDFVPSSGLMLRKKAYINLGKIQALNFKDNFSFSMWISYMSIYKSAEMFSKKADDVYVLRFGNVFLDLYGHNVCLCKTNRDNRTGAHLTDGTPYYFTDDYFMLTVTVSNGVANVYRNGVKQTTRYDGGTFSIDTNLSSTDLIIGPSSFDWGYVSDIRFYDKVMSDTEVEDLYRGW